MSDLAATNCQTTCNDGCGWSGGSSNSWIIILFLLFFCNGGSSWSGRNDGCGCESIIWILLLLCCCGNNSGTFGLGCGCGC